ncbi:MAG: hypothetical protein AAGA86_04975 [Bacteroidota bacterium]
MGKITFCIMALLMVLGQGVAQENPETEAAEALREQLDRIEEEEKAILRKQVENINSLLENGVIDQTKAEELKIKAAEERTKKIDERQGVLRETLFFLESNIEKPKKKDEVEILLDVDSYAKETPGVLLDLSPSKDRVGTAELDYDKTVNLEERVESDVGKIYSPTTVDLVFALGLNNTVWEGISWERDIEEEADYLFYSSRFWELGFTLKTPLEEKNRIRLKYGLSYQLNELEPSGNRYFSQTEGLVQLQDFPGILLGSRFVAHNIVFPIHLELGPTRLKSGAKGGYYSTSNRFKIGFGGYLGLNLTSRQELEYPVILRRQRFTRLEVIDDFPVNREVYGISAYIGFGAFSLYGKYDLNAIFENGLRDEQFVSMGFRIDL